MSKYDQSPNYNPNAAKNKLIPLEDYRKSIDPIAVVALIIILTAIAIAVYGAACTMQDIEALRLAL